MKPASQVRIVDITRSSEYQNYLYRCLAPMPFRKYRNRQEYLEKAIPKGFHKKLLILDKKIVGQIEYAPAEASSYPIFGEDIVVMNCIWVLRRAKGHNFGKLLLKDMLKSENHAAGFATIALENHWSPWFRKQEMEGLGFKPIDSIRVTHRIKRKSQVFTIYLTWMPTKQKAQPPTWDKQKLLEGETFCLAHPLYHPQTWKGNVFEAK
jgi:N-acetylglutamate synthase-like GNAT family acetyltransferase